jgi:hypothetical protein
MGNLCYPKKDKKTIIDCPIPAVTKKIMWRGISLFNLRSVWIPRIMNINIAGIRKKPIVQAPRMTKESRMPEDIQNMIDQFDLLDC